MSQQPAKADGAETKQPSKSAWFAPQLQQLDVKESESGGVPNNPDADNCS